MLKATHTIQTTTKPLSTPKIKPSKELIVLIIGIFTIIFIIKPRSHKINIETKNTETIAIAPEMVEEIGSATDSAKEYSSSSDIVNEELNRDSKADMSAPQFSTNVTNSSGRASKRNEISYCSALGCINDATMP
jgi:Arc/MetJ-type ribon-helix-helix transcriptional regulator